MLNWDAAASVSAMVVSLKNECNKPFTIRPTCGIHREGEKKTLYLYNTETRTFYDIVFYI